MPDFTKMSDDELMAILGNKPKPLSGEEVTRGLITKAGQGLTFGTLGAIAPAAYAATGKAFEFAKKVPKAYQTPFRDLYKEGRKDFEETTGKVERAMPKTAFAAEVVGGLPLGLGGAAETAGLPLLQKMIPAAKMGAKFGAAYGGGSALGKGVETALEGKPVEAAKDVSWSTSKGALIGAAVAPPLTFATAPIIERVVPIVNKIIKTSFGKGKEVAAGDIIRAAQSDSKLVHPADVISSDVKPDLAKRSVTENKSLLEIGDRNVVKLAQKARLSNERANEILTEHVDQVHAKQSPEIEAVINKHFGEISPSENVEAIQERYKAAAEPLYNEALAHGEVESLTQLRSTLTGEEKTLNTNEKVIKEYIQEARNSLKRHEIEGLPDNDIRVLDAAKRQIDDELYDFKTGRPTKRKKDDIRYLNEARKYLLEKTDAEVPIYAKARKVSSDNLSLLHAQEEAGKFLKGETVESTKAKMKDYSPAERESFILGVRQELMNKLYNKSGTENKNIAQAVFEGSEYGMLRRKLKEVVGEKFYKSLMDDINPLVKSGQNVSNLIGGSPTAERESMKGWSSIPRMLKKEVGKSLSKKINETYEDVAKALVDPAYLRKILQSKTETPIQDMLTNTPNIAGRVVGVKGSK
jgi:hypothetical protein